MRHWFHSVNVRLSGGTFVLIAVFAVPSGATAQASAFNRQTIIVRSYTDAGSAGDIRDAKRSAAAIVRRADIDVLWLDCTLPDSVETRERCSLPIDWNEVVLRVVPAVAADTRRDAEDLGFALVVVNERHGSLATVYSDRVAARSRRAGVDAAELLGRVIAHEIGHLLLGTNRHGSRGLMRASWTGADLRRNLATDWLFLNKEGTAMRVALAARARALDPDRPAS
jgi:hypothetical protein